VNERRCREAAYHFIAAGMLSEAADELCSFEGICARARCGEASTNFIQLLDLSASIKNELKLRNASAFHRLQQVEHYAAWLKKDLSSIAENPDMQVIFDSCCRQPYASLARKDLMTYMQRTSAGPSFGSGSMHRSFVLGRNSQNFDSCISELKHHKSSVGCVAYNVDGSLLASASDDKTVAIWNTKTGMVDCVLKGHTEAVTSVAWCMAPDNRQLLATGSADKTVRVWDVSSMQQVAELKGHTDYVTSVVFDSSGKYLASGEVA